MYFHISMKRIINLIKNHKNWLGYLVYKYFIKSKKGFRFKTRSGIKIQVPKRMLHTYKECFFDQTYLKGFPGIPDLDNKATILDIGANVGYFSLFMFNLYRSITIYAFEPIPANYELLEKYHSENPDLDFHILNQAVGLENDKLILNYDAADKFTTSATVFNTLSQPDTIEVKSVTLSSVAQGNHIHQIDFLKLDCEGSEYDILYNSPEELLAQIKAVSIETHPGNKKGADISSLSAYLAQHGFEIKIFRSHIWGWKKSLNFK